MSRADAWDFPVNSESKLFIAHAEDRRSFGDLLSLIRAHFGGAPSLGEFDIEFIRWTHVRECSCCSDSGTYGNYWEITRRQEPCEYTTNYLLSDLCRD